VNLNGFKYFFLSGKGGVGKTTSSILMALYFSQRGEKTLLVSLDPAHSLGIALKAKLGELPKKVEEKLFALEVNPEKEMEKYLKKVEKEARQIVSPAFLGEVEEELKLAHSSPGALELATADAIYRIAVEGRGFDKIVFDTAPSGYTVRLVASPNSIVKWWKGLISVREEALKYEFLSNLKEKRKLKEIFREDPILKVLTKRLKEYETLKELFTGKETAFGVVFNEGLLPREIGVRTVRELEEAGAPVKFLVFNRVKNGIESLKAKNKIVIKVPEFKEEPIGIEKLKELLKLTRWEVK